MNILLLSFLFLNRAQKVNTTAYVLELVRDSGSMLSDLGNFLRIQQNKETPTSPEDKSAIKFIRSEVPGQRNMFYIKFGTGRFLCKKKYNFGVTTCDKHTDENTRWRILFKDNQEIGIISEDNKCLRPSFYDKWGKRRGFAVKVAPCQRWIDYQWRIKKVHFSDDDEESDAESIISRLKKRFRFTKAEKRENEATKPAIDDTRDIEDEDPDSLGTVTSKTSVTDKTAESERNYRNIEDRNEKNKQETIKDLQNIVREMSTIKKRSSKINTVKNIISKKLSSYENQSSPIIRYKYETLKNLIDDLEEVKSASLTRKQFESIKNAISNFDIKKSTAVSQQDYDSLKNTIESLEKGYLLSLLHKTLKP